MFIVGIQGQVVNNCALNDIKWDSSPSNTYWNNNKIISPLTVYVNEGDITISKDGVTKQNEVCGAIEYYGLGTQPNNGTVDATLFSAASLTGTITIQDSGAHNSQYDLQFHTTAWRNKNGDQRWIQGEALLFTVNYIDRCASTTITSTTLSSMTITVNSAAATKTVLFQDSVSLAKGSADGAAFCGARQTTITGSTTYSSWLTLDQSTGTFTASSSSSLDVGSYTVNFEQCLVKFPLICATGSFDVVIQHCQLNSLTYSSSVNTAYWLAGDIRDRVVQISQGQITIPFDGVILQSSSCGYALEYAMTVSPVTTPTLFTLTAASGVINVLDSGVHGTVYTVTLQVKANDLRTNTYKNAADVVFTVTYNDDCMSTAFTDTGATLAPDITITRLQTYVVAQHYKTVAFKNTVANAKSNANYCGAHTTTLISSSQPWLTVYPTANSFKVESTSTSDVGAVVQYKVCLVNYPTICTATKSFTVTINPCQVTSITATNAASYTGQTQIIQIDAPVYTESFPTYTQSPACGYAIQTYTILQGSASPPSPPFSHASSTANTFDIQKTVRTESSHLITFKILLDSANCAGVCQHSTVTKTYSFVDKCKSATLTVETINDMSTSVNAGAQTDTFLEFKDNVSSNYGTMDGLTYCGARTYTINYPGFLSISGTTITLNSVTASDITNSPYTATVTAKLANWPTVPTVTKTFTVTIGQCFITSFTQASSIYHRTIQEYVLMGTAKAIDFPTFVQTPSCGYALTYTVTKVAADSVNSLSYYPTGTSYADAYDYPNPVSVSNLANIETINTSTKKYIADIKTHIPSITNLGSYQYQGDYLITIQASYLGNAPQGDFGFILRVINPCLHSSFTTNSVYALNTLTAPVIASIDTSVRLSKAVTFAEFTDAASAAYTTVDDYTMCGARTYTIDGTTPTWLTLDSAAKSLTVYTEDNADIAYTNYNGGCHSVVLRSRLNTYPSITQTQTVSVCIEECKPTAFTAVARPTATETYTIFDTQKQILTYGYTQVPACGYSIVYSAIIEKTSQNTLVSSATYTATALTQTSHSYIKFQNPTEAVTSPNGHSQLLVHSQSTPDSGDYGITIIAVLQETKYSQTFYTNSDDQFEVTIIDPCSSALVNDFLGTTSPYYRKVQDLTISVKGGPASFYFYQFIDSVSKVRDNSGLYTWDALSDPLVSDLNAGSTTCGRRKYTLGGDYVSSMTWLTSDWTNGLISVETNNDADINYSGNTNRGYRVTLQGCLELYPSRCSSTLTFYVKISECQIISFLPTAGEIQPDITHNIYATELTQSIISYTQNPLCGWTITYSAKVDTVVYTSSAFPWLSLDQSPAQYRVYSTNIAHKGLRQITQFATLNDQINGAAISTTTSGTFKITLTDPCEITTIQSQSADDELFSTQFIANQTAKLTTSVLYGTDIVTQGISVKYEFPIHNDTSSNSLVVPGKQFACGDRTYNIISFERNGIVASPSPTFLTNNIVNASASSMAAITASDADIGLWKVQVQISLKDYDIAVYPNLILTEYFYISIESCIINQITASALGSAATIATNPLTPFTYDLFKLYASELQLNSYTIKPACNYVLKYKLEILPDKTLATEVNLGLKNSASLTTKLSFDSDDRQLDLCSYGVNDTSTGITNLRQCGTINPYHVNFVAYVDDVNANIKSVTLQNDQTKFYVWPKDPCREAVLTPEFSINQNVTIKYFLNGDQIDTAFNKTTDNVTMSAAYGGGRSQCGLINYMIVQKLFDDPGPVSTTVKQTSSPVITTFSDNQFTAGLQEQRVKSWLADYEFVTAYSEFKVMVYQILTSQSISIKYYQIAKKKLELNIEAFQVSPISTEFELIYSYIVYKMPEETQLLVSPGVTFDPVTMKVEVFTRDFINEGHYKIQIRAQARDALTKVEYSSLGTLDFELIITRDPPPISTVPAPLFTSSLEPQKFYFGEEMPPYKLPTIVDPSGFVIEAPQIVKKPNWLLFDEDSQTFSVDRGATTDKEVGYYRIKIKLSNSGGGSDVYDLIVQVEMPIVYEIVEEVKEVVDISPVPRISKVSERGVITISWNRAIKIPRNLTFTRQVNITYLDKNTSTYQTFPGLYIEVNSGGVTPKKDLSFTWYYKSWNSKAIEIQLVFDSPLLVSQADNALDWFKIIFYDERLFIDSRQNQKVKGGPDPEKGHVLQAELPAQIPIFDKPVEPLLSPAATVAAEIGQVIFQLTLSYFLNSLWSMVSTQQLIVLIPLFKFELPLNAGEFFAYMMQIAAFDIIPMDLLFDYLFDVEVPGPITENFGTVGFGTTFFFYNLGSLVLALFSFPVFVVVSKVLKRCTFSGNLMRRGANIERSIYWNQTIDILSTSYTILIVCSQLQMIALDWSSWPTCLMSGFSIYYFFVSIIFPFFQAFWCYKNLHRLRDEDFQQRWKSMYDGKIIYDENAGKPMTGFIYYNFMYIARRFMLGMIVVHFRETLFYQISGLAFQTIMAVMVAGSTNSFEDKRLNKLEYFNEIMILMCMYNVMCFTDFQPDKELQYMQGWFMVFCVLFHIAFNLSFVFFDEIWRLKVMYRRFQMMRKRTQLNRKHRKKKRRQTAKIMKKGFVEKKPVEKPMNENHDMSYEMQLAPEQGNISISSIDQSNQDINQNDNQNLALVSRVPVDASEAIFKQVKEFDDGAGKVDNKDFGRQINREYKKNFEQDVHKQLARAVPLDPYFDDLQKVFEQDEPEEWKQLKFVDRLARPAPKEKEIPQQDLNSLLNLHNRLMRPTHGDFKKQRQVQPVFKKDLGMRAKVDEQAVHDRLFVQLDKGDGMKLNSQQLYQNKKSKRKQIIEPTLARDYEPARIIVPILRENMTPEQEAAADERDRLEAAQKQQKEASQQKKDNFQLMTNENQLIIDDEWNF